VNFVVNLILVGMVSCVGGRQLLKELDAPVEYIVLPTFAYEHKIFVGLFSQIPESPGVGGASAVELVYQPMSAAVWHL
jgi:hypothetical protein